MSNRRDQLVEQAARMFAVRGFHGVTLDELGAAVGISGPAVYKHFANKDALLAAVLIEISEALLAGARSVLGQELGAKQTLLALIEAHIEFALTRPELIRVQDRDLANLSVAAARQVRRLQRAYVEIWVDVLLARDPGLSRGEARIRAHGVFGLLNSTPYSLGSNSPAAERDVLRRMAWSALGVAVGRAGGLSKSGSGQFAKSVPEI